MKYEISPEGNHLINFYYNAYFRGSLQLLELNDVNAVFLAKVICKLYESLKEDIADENKRDKICTLKDVQSVMEKG